jgi:hypothetical protein
LIAFTLAGLAYGGIHLIVWNYPFTSHVQRVLWRISGVAIAASGPFSVCMAISIVSMSNSNKGTGGAGGAREGIQGWKDRFLTGLSFIFLTSGVFSALPLLFVSLLRQSVPRSKLLFDVSISPRFCFPAVELVDLFSLYYIE